MCSKDHVDISLYNFCQLIEEFPQFFFYINITISVTKVLNTGLSVLVADMPDAHRFCPVNGIYDQCLAHSRM